MSDTFASDLDTFMLDERLLKLGMIFSGSQQGSPSPRTWGRFPDALAMAFGPDKPSPIIVNRLPICDDRGAGVSSFAGFSVALEGAAGATRSSRSGWTRRFHKGRRVFRGRGVDGTDASGSALINNGVLIPYYLSTQAFLATNPNVQGLLDAMKSHRDVPVLVIVNPGTGPGTVNDVVGIRLSGWCKARAEKSLDMSILLMLSGLKLTLKLKSANGSLSTPILKFDGIFFDQMPWDTGPRQCRRVLTSICTSVILITVMV